MLDGEQIGGGTTCKAWGGLTSTPFYLLVLSFLDLQTFPIISWCRLVVQKSSLLQTTVFCHRQGQVGTAADLQLFNPP